MHRAFCFHFTAARQCSSMASVPVFCRDFWAERKKAPEGQDDLECAPRCSAHKQRKNYFYFAFGATAFAERSVAMKAPVGLLSGRAVLRSKMEGLCPDKLGGICDKGYHGLQRASKWFCKIYCGKVAIVGLIIQQISNSVRLRTRR